MPEHIAISGDMDIEPAHIVQACSQAEHASMHSCITVTSMPCIESECISIICIAVFDIIFVQPGPTRVGGSGGSQYRPDRLQPTPGRVSMSVPRPL